MFSTFDRSVNDSEFSELTNSNKDEFSELTDWESEKTAFLQRNDDGVSKWIKAENEHKRCHEFLELTHSESETSNETLLDFCNFTGIGADENLSANLSGSGQEQENYKKNMFLVLKTLPAKVMNARKTQI